MTDTVKPGEEQVNTGDLKDKFSARSIPLEKDFHDLIDMADAGRLAAGLSPEQDGTKDSTATGLIIDTNKRLAIKTQPDGGLKVDNSGVGVNTDNTLAITSNGQLGVADKYVTKNGDSIITGGNLTFASDDNGIEFFGGGKIAKKLGAGLYWYKDDNGRLPAICDHDGGNPSPVATEQFVQNAISALNYRTLALQCGGINYFGETDKFFALVRATPIGIKVFFYGKGNYLPVTTGNKDGYYIVPDLSMPTSIASQIELSPLVSTKWDGDVELFQLRTAIFIFNKPYADMTQLHSAITAATFLIKLIDVTAVSPLSTHIPSDEAQITGVPF